MSVFFVHDPGRGIVTPLKKDFFRRPITKTEALSKTQGIHEKLEPSKDQYQQPNLPLANNAKHDETIAYLDVDSAHEGGFGIVEMYMSAPLIQISLDHTLSEAWELMCKHDIHHLAITNSRHELQTLLSYKDITEESMAKQQKIDGQTPLSAFCGSEIISTAPDTEIEAVAQALLELGLDGMTVTHQGKAIGVITRSDILKIFLKNDSLNIRA